MAPNKRPIERFWNIDLEHAQSFFSPVTRYINTKDGMFCNAVLSFENSNERKESAFKKGCEANLSAVRNIPSKRFFVQKWSRIRKLLFICCVKLRWRTDQNRWWTLGRSRGERGGGGGPTTFLVEKMPDFFLWRAWLQCSLISDHFHTKSDFFYLLCGIICHTKLN